LWEVLEWFNVPKYIVQAVQAAYDGAEIQIRLDNCKLSQRIRVEIGVLQGCTLSPILFDIVADLMLRVLNANTSLMVREGLSVGSASYADDLAQVEPSKTPWRCSKT
jgi:hypothetical protein